MKKFFSIVMLCTVLLSLAGCVDKEAQEAVQTYIDTASATFGVQEKLMLESYTSVIGANYTDDSTMCLEFVTNTIPLATSLQTTVEGITESITNEDVLRVHNIYLSYVSEFVDALRLLLTAVDEQDQTIAAEANAMLNNANTYTEEFRAGLQELKEKYDLE